MSFEPIPLTPQKKKPWKFIILGFVIVIAISGIYIYRYFFSPSSPRWSQYRPYLKDNTILGEARLEPGVICGEAPFAFPTSGVIFGLWNQSYRPGHIHAGLDIFSGTQPGVIPNYSVYPGYITRKPEWISTVIIRIPSDPLNPVRQIWTYYTHMANAAGTESYISAEFPAGTEEVFIPAGTYLGRQGNYSGNPNNPTGLHLHFSVVKDDGQGQFLNELEINNTFDPTPYFEMALNHADNLSEFPVCKGDKKIEDWDLITEDE
jgi:hypothetical protein